MQLQTLMAAFQDSHATYNENKNIFRKHNYQFNQFIKQTWG